MYEYSKGTKERVPLACTFTNTWTTSPPSPFPAVTQDIRTTRILIQNMGQTPVVVVLMRISSRASGVAIALRSIPAYAGGLLDATICCSRLSSVRLVWVGPQSLQEAQAVPWQERRHRLVMSPRRLRRLVWV